MCTGAEIALLAGAAASLAGTGVSVSAQQQATSRMNRAMRQQLADQRGFQRKATGLLQQNIEDSTPEAVTRDIDEGAVAAKALYDKVQDIPLSINEAVDTRDRGYQQLTGEQAAQLQGLTSQDLMRWIRNLQSNTKLGVLANQARLRASILPFELQGAQNSTAGLAGLGSLLQSAGNVASTYGAQGGAFQPKAGMQPSAPTSSQFMALQQGQGPLNPQMADRFATQRLIKYPLFGGY